MSPASKRVGKEAKNAEYPVLLGPPGAPLGSVWRLYGSHYSHMRSSLPFRCFPLLTIVKIGKKSQKSENVTFGKNLDLAGDPKFRFF